MLTYMQEEVSRLYIAVPHLTELSRYNVTIRHLLDIAFGPLYSMLYISKKGTVCLHAADVMQ